MRGILAAGLTLVLVTATSCTTVRTSMFSPQSIHAQSCLHDCRANYSDCNSAQVASGFLLLPLFIVGMTFLVLGGGGGGSGSCGPGNWGGDCPETFHQCEAVCRGVESRAYRR